MKKLIIKNVYERNFLTDFLPNIVKKIFLGELNLSKYSLIFNYIEANYNIKKYKIIENIVDNIKIAKTPELVTIYIDNNIKNISYFDNLLNLIDYGNLDIRGTYALTKSFNYIRSNIDTIYKFFILRGKSNLWQ